MNVADVAYALLSDNRLVVVSLTLGTLLAARALGLPPPASAHPEWWRSADGHYLAISKSHQQLYVIVPELVPGRVNRPDRLVIVDTSTAQVHATYSLPRGVAFHSLAVGPASGHLYLFGFRAVGRFGSSPADEVVTVVDPNTGALLATWTARTAHGHDWFPFRGLVSRDERKLFISYHGPDTTGIDTFTISHNRLFRCRSSAGPEAVCTAAHGNIELYGDGLLASNGQGTIEEVDAAGTVRRQLATHLEGNHLLEFVVDRRQGRIYAVGSCAYAGGFSWINVRTGQTKVLVRPRNYEICGERLALDPRSRLLLVAKTQGVLPEEAAGSLLEVDTETGTLRRTISTPREAIDVLIVQ